MAVTAAQALALRAAKPVRPSGPSCRLPRNGGARNRTRGEGGGRGLFRGVGRSLAWGLGLALGLGFFVLVSVGLLASFRWLQGNDSFALRQVEVRGMDRLTAEEVVVLAGVEQGGSLLDVSIAEVMDRLAAYPWIASATVRRELPDCLRITVQEKAPAWWLADGGGLLYADAGGDPIAPVAADRFVSLPVLEVEPGAEDLVPTLPRDLAGLARLDAAFGVERAAWVRLGIAEVSLYFDAPDLLLTLERGPGEPWSLSLQRLAVVWTDLARRGESEGARYVTVKNGKAWAGTAAAD
ncbi:MAG: FtsQ-type POTRA domain-containing protein [Thermodesulfobacteriota bacterium]